MNDSRTDKRIGAERPDFSLTSFLRDERGASAIEFAMVAIPLFWLIMATVEFGLLMFTQVSLETALGNVARTTTIGSVGGGFPDRVSYLKAELKRQTDTLIYGDNVIVSSEPVSTGPSSYVEPEMCLTDPPTLGPSCPPGTPFVDSNGNGVYDSGTLNQNFGGAGELVEINVALPWKFFTPLVGKLFGSDQVVGGTSPLDGTYIIRSSAIVVNEPFGS